MLVTTTLWSCGAQNMRLVAAVKTTLRSYPSWSPPIKVRHEGEKKSAIVVHNRVLTVVIEYMEDWQCTISSSVSFEVDQLDFF